MMRVYEFAKEQNISSKELIELLQDGGHDVASHMSVLDEAALAFLTDFFGEDEEMPAVKTEKIKKAKKLEGDDKILEKTTEKKAYFQKKERPKTQDKPVSAEEKKDLLIIQPMSVANFAEKANIPATEVIVTLLKWGVVASKNQIISEDIVSRLVQHYDLPVAQPKKQAVKEEHVITTTEALKERPPVVVVLGHVDHGKTTLLDFVRKTRVAAKEKGGITQHLGAYKAHTPQGDIVFIDTPGHEAFSKIRQRGLRVADIAIIVVAADDGVMPQTVEAINFAKTLEVPIVVAINKMDKVDASRAEVVRRQISQYDLLPEEWGGDVVCVPISAKVGTGVDHLLEMIVLQSQMMELRAATTGHAKGYVLESKLEKGRGPVATLICQHGTLKVGDYFVCGSTRGKINSLVDTFGKRVKSVGPVVPIQAAGFESLPEAGDFFSVVTKDEYRKISSATKPTARSQKLIQEGGINIILKVDTNSTKEALIDSINKLSKKTVKPFNIIDASVGSISEGDIEFAYSTGAEIVGLHVKAEANAANLAQQRGVKIDLHTIIYKLLEYLEERAEQEREVVVELKKIGEASVLKVFDIKKVGVIAGAYIKDGRFSRDGIAKVWRNGQLVGEGKITSLQRDRKTVKEVHTGFECAFMVEKFTDWEVDDRVECYIKVPK